MKKSGGTFRLATCLPFVTKGDVPDFRPFSIVAAADGGGLWLVDWANTGWLTAGRPNGTPLPPALHWCRIDRRHSLAPTEVIWPNRIASLDHPALRSASSRNGSCASGNRGNPPLIARLKTTERETGRLHAIWCT